MERYVGEFTFRWNNRKASDSERMIAAIAKVNGKRLTYQKLILS